MIELSSSSEPESSTPSECKLESLSCPEDTHHVHASPSRVLACGSRPDWDPTDGILPIHTYRIRALSKEEIEEEKDRPLKRRRT
jgi:hypothetical protein